VLTCTLTAPDVEPAVVGFEVTVTVQLAPAANDPMEQLFVCAKGPLTVIDVSVIAAPESLVSVAVCDALVLPIVVAANVREPGENNRDPVVPVPVSVAVCGLLAALSLNVIVSFFAPGDVGLNSSETVQEVPPASVDGEAGQLFAEM